MKKWSWFVAPAIVVTLAALPAHAAKKPASPTAQSRIWISSIDGVKTAASTTSPTPALGDTLTFGTDPVGLAGWEYPMVAVWCYQGDVVVDMQLQKPDTQFLLGGASSTWLDNPGPANCFGRLYAYGWKGGNESIRFLADQPFSATG